MVNLFYFYKLHIVYFILYLCIIVNLILQIDVIVLCIDEKKPKTRIHHIIVISNIFLVEFT